MSTGDDRHFALEQETLYGGRFEDLATEGTEHAGELRSLVAFVLGGELYGVPLSDVTEIRELLPLMPLPRVPPHVLGLINLRGLVLPVIDLRRKYGLAVTTSKDNRLLILKGAGYLVAMVVDAVDGIARLPVTAFQAAPPGVARIDADYYRQVAGVGGRMLIELDVQRMLSDTASSADHVAP